MPPVLVSLPQDVQHRIDHPMLVWKQQRYRHSVELAEKHHHYVPRPENAGVELCHFLVTKMQYWRDTSNLNTQEHWLEAEGASGMLLCFPEVGPKQLQQCWP